MIITILPEDTNLTKLYHYSYNCALKNIAKKYNLEYFESCLSCMDHLTNFTFALPEHDSPIIFKALHPNFGPECEAVIRAKCPNAKIVMTGGDTIYYGVDTSTRMNCCLFIDTIKSQVELLQDRLPSEHIYWTISEDLINLCSTVPLEDKDDYTICLCAASYARQVFFGQIPYPIKYGLQEHNVNNIISLYQKSKIVLGTTSPSPGFGDHNHRSMKGMRDWIGAFCGTVLIADDYPDIVDIGTNIVPTYEYGNASHCWDLMQFIINDPVVYNAILYNQQRWLLEHTMEKQLERILLKHNLLMEK